MKFAAILFCCCLSAPLANAQWTFRPQAGLGYTDNANYEDTGKDSDLFWWLRSSNSYNSELSHYYLWLNYRSYMKEHQNDVFSYRLGDTMDISSRSYGSFDWDLALGGQQYSEGSPATTEESFNNTYFETSLTKTWNKRSDLETSLETLYQLKSYSQLNDRIDHTFALNFAADWQFRSVQSLHPFAELGFVFSNQTLYSKNYLEVGSDWRVFPQPDVKYILHFLSRYSTFPSRTVSETTVVRASRGRLRILSQNEIETQSFTQLQGSAIKMLGSVEVQGSLALNIQRSRSGIEDYSETQILASVLRPF